MLFILLFFAQIVLKNMLFALLYSKKWGLCEYVIVHTILGGSPVILWISLGGNLDTMT